MFNILKIYMSQGNAATLHIYTKNKEDECIGELRVVLSVWVSFLKVDTVKT